MKKFVLTAMCLVMLAPFAASLNADQEYAAFSSIGYGPLEGEMITPWSMGTDESGRIFVIDKTSRKGLVFLDNGSYFKTIIVPQSVDCERLSPNISINTGMVAYPSGNTVTIASSDGEVSAVCGLGSGNPISRALKVKIMDDFSILVLDEKFGISKYTRDGNLVGQKVLPGSIPSAPVINSFDVSDAGEIVLLSITMEQPKTEEGAPEPNRNSIVQFTFLDPEFKFRSTFKLATNDAYNPQVGEVEFIDSNKISFMSTTVSGFTDLDLKGNVVFEGFKGVPEISRSFAANSHGYFVVGSGEFYHVPRDGKELKVLGKFANNPMKFAMIEQISQNGDGFAVFDSRRNDVQFFTSKGYSGLKSVASGSHSVLFSNHAGNACLYLPNSHTVKVFEPGGTQIGTFQIEEKVGLLDRIVRGIGEEFLGLASDAGLIIRISKEGFFIHKFGQIGRDQDQFQKPVDLLSTPDKMIHVLDENGTIKVFDGNGKFARSYGLPDGQARMKHPTAMVLLPNLDVMVSDTGNDRIIVFGQDGKLKYAMGKTSPSRIKRNVGDYSQDIGTFVSPGQLAVSGENIFVIDKGNIRIQILRKEKVVPKITVDKSTIDFGAVKEGMVSEKIVIRNAGNGVLEGSVVCDASWLELSKRTIAGNETVIEIRCLADKVPYWNAKTGEIVINSNGGLVKITVSATKTGKKIRLQVGSQKAYIDERETPMNVPPTLVGNNTMVPLRFIGEALSATVDWNAEDKKVTYVLGQKTVIVWIGKKDALVDGMPVTMTAAPVIIKGKTLVPLRFVGEALGATVEWVGESKTIIVYYPPKP